MVNNAVVNNGLHPGGIADAHVDHGTSADTHARQRRWRRHGRQIEKSNVGYDAEKEGKEEIVRYICVD